MAMAVAAAPSIGLEDAPPRRRRVVLAWLAMVVALFIVMLPLGSAAFAATGSVLRDIIPGGTTDNGRGLAFDGTNLWYTLVGDSHIYKVSTTGAPLGSITVAGDVSKGGPLAWDGSALWTANYSDPSNILYRINPANGAILSSCDIAAANPGNPAVPGPKGITSFPDGLDWSGTTLWMSGEGALNPGNWVAELDTSCHILNSFIAPPHGGDGASGLAFAGGSQPSKSALDGLAAMRGRWCPQGIPVRYFGRR